MMEMDVLYWIYQLKKNGVVLYLEILEINK